MLIAAGLATLGLATLGLPGAVVLEAAEVLAGSISSARLGSDQVWPGALAISALGPFTLVPAHLVLRRAHLPYWRHVMLTLLLAFVVTLVVSAMGVVFSGRVTSP